MPNYAQLATPSQTQRATPAQVQNNAGGYVFQLDAFQTLERFLILGSDKPTYYQSAQALTVENAQCVKECWTQDPSRTAQVIAQISSEGRAPKNDPAIFAVALGVNHTDEVTRSHAYAIVNRVCRTATHLFQFVELARDLGKGWGRGMKRVVGGWYENRDANNLAYQVIKYRSRHNYDHRRILQTTHPKGASPAHSALYRWVLDKPVIPVIGSSDDLIPQIVHDFEEAQAGNALEVLRRNPNLPWEAIPTDALNDAKLWGLMIPTMGLTALMRNLGRITNLGLLKPLSTTEATIIARFRNEAEIKAARLHPFNILVAMKTYSSGQGFRGSSSWTPNRSVVAALENAFYLAFGNVEQSNKRTLVGLDISGSMNAAIMGSPVSCREAAATMAMVTLRNTGQTFIRGFANNGFVDLGITTGDSLNEVLSKAYRSNFGRTDCSIPMEYAIDAKLDVDQFVVYTDNETYAGRRHPFEALKDYRKHSGINAKLVVVGMTSTRFSIADPSDAGMLDVVGFDTAAPDLIARF